MLTSQILSYLIGIVGLVGVAFSVWNKVKDPQQEVETKQAIQDKELGNKATLLAAKEAEGKALLLAQQVSLQKEAYDKKFSEIGVRLDSLDSKLVDLVNNSNIWHLDISKLLVELSTRLDERLPSRRDMIK
jgi:hypothetical protein